MLEALEEIRSAEKKIDENKQKMLAEVQKYSDEKAAELEQHKLQNHQKLNQLIAEREQQEKEQLQSEKERLLMEAQEVKQNLQEQYEKHYQQAIDTIIERVKETYGSH